MNPVFTEILKQIIIAIAGISIVGATVATGTMGASNLVSKFTEKEHTIAQVRADEDTSNNESLSDVPSNKLSDSVKSTDTPKPTPKKIAAAVALVSPTGTTSPSVKNTTGCIITLFGQQYNVSTLQQTHSGGNIFNCGTDMTSVYQGKHGSNVSRMQQYLVSAIGTGGTISGSSGSTGASGTTAVQIDDDDSDEVEHEDEEREEEMKKVLESAKKELEQDDD